MESNTSTNFTVLKEKLLSNLEILADANQKERELLHEARSSLDALPTRSLSLITREISSLLDHRISSVKNLRDEIPTVQMEIKSQFPPIVTQRIRHPQLSLLQEPKEVSFGDRWIVPSPVVQIDEISRFNDYNVRVALWFSSSDREVTMGDSNEPALVGTTLVPFDKDGTAHFKDLIVSDVGAKARRQSFVLQFTLEAINANNASVSHLRSSSFVAQTRPATVLKRKSRDSNDEEQIWTKKPTEDVQTSPSAKPKSSQSPEYNYVDITDLLTLPQKEAAQRLHISESMLCKRFKECTRRKWPYRYLCKIEKVINLLYNQSEGQLSDEDKEKLDRLIQEREECLQPVRIRIIPHERDNAAEDASNSIAAMNSSSNISSSEESSPSPPPKMASTPIKFSDEDVMVMHTLEMLKSQIPTTMAKRDP